MARISRLLVVGTLCLATFQLQLAQSAFVSLTGDFPTAGNQHDFLFTVTRPINSGEVLQFETFAHGGGTNAAGHVITGGGIDSELELWETPVANLHGYNDDGSFQPGNDSLLSWPEVAQSDDAPLNPDPLPAADYRLNLSEYGDDATGHWAVDLVGPADAFVFQGDSPAGANPPSTLATLTAGLGAQVSFADSYEIDNDRVFRFHTSSDFTLASYLDVGNGSNGTLLVEMPGTSLTTNTVSTTYMEWGRDAGVANITVHDRASADLRATRIDLAADSNPASAGSLAVVGGADVTANTLNVGTGNGQGAIVVRDAGSTLTQNAASTLTIGAASGGLLDYLEITDDGLFNSGTGPLALYSSGWVNVDSGGTLQAQGPLTVASTKGGADGVSLTNGGRINSVDVNIATNAANGSVRINGFMPAPGFRATWDVTGSMTVGSYGLGTGTALVEQTGRLQVSQDLTVASSDDAHGTLTVQTGGDVTVGGTLTIDGSPSLARGVVQLRDGTITTHSMVIEPGGVLQHEDGLLTVDGGQFTVELGTLTIDSATGSPTLRLQDGAQGSVEFNPAYPAMGDAGFLYLGLGGQGRMEIVGGSTMVSGGGQVGIENVNPNPADGSVLVEGIGSKWEITGQHDATSHYVGSLAVGRKRNGTLEINNGAQVIVQAGNVNIGSAPSTLQDTQGVVTVAGVGSLLKLVGQGPHGHLIVGTSSATTAPTGLVTITNQGHLEVAKSITVRNAGTIYMTVGGSEIHADSFLVEPGGTFTHHGGTLIVDGGEFRPVPAGFDYAIDAAGLLYHPTVRLQNRASNAAVPADLYIGRSFFGELDVTSGSTYEVTGDVHLGYFSTSTGTIRVDGVDSKLTIGGDLEVGDGSLGTMHITGGGVVDSTGIGSHGRDVIGDDVVAGSLIEVADPNSRWDTDTLVVGNNGPGHLAIIHNATVNTNGDAFIGRLPGDAMSNVHVGLDHTGGTWNVDQTLWVGGGTNAEGPGQIAGVIVYAGGALEVGSHLKVWPTGTVTMEGGTILAPHQSVNLAGGTLSGRGTVEGPLWNNGHVDLGSGDAGVMNISDDYNQSSTSVLTFDLFGSGGVAGVDFDHLAVDGTATLGGNLEVRLQDFTPALGEVFEIITAGQVVTGQFDTMQLPTPSSLLRTGVFYGTTTVTLAVLPALDGDYNADGSVNAADYTVWRDALGQVGIGLPADGDRSGDVDTLDYQLWKLHYGTQLLSGSGTAVPEPTGMWLMLLAGITVRGRLRVADKELLVASA